MTDRMKEAIKAATQELMAMDDELAKELDAAKDTPMFHTLNYATKPDDYYNCIRCGKQNIKDDSENCAFCGKLQIMPDYNVWRGNEI